MIALEPYLSFARIEIFNSHRLSDYLIGSPLQGVTAADCGGDGYDAGPYVTPAQDSAPWYSATVAESADFLGFAADQTKSKIGWTGGRSFGEVVSIGSSAGPLRRTGLTITFEDVWLVGRSCEALDYGMSWLQWRLTLPDCPVDAAVYLCPGTAAKQRTLCRVSLAELEETTPAGVDRCRLRLIRLVLRAELPYLLGVEEECLTGSFTAPDALVGSDGWNGAAMALGPGGFWRLNDGTATMTDGSGNGRHGSHVNTPTLSQPSLIASDAVDLSVAYDGSTEYSTVPDNAAWDQASFGFGIWFNSTGGDASRRRLVERLTTGAAGLLWIMTYDPVAGQVEALVQFPSGQVRISGGVIADSETHWAVFMVDRSGGVSTLRLYVDGVQVASGSMGGAQLANSDQGLTFGRRSLAAATNYFGGRLDEAIFFTEDETPAVIAALYAIATQTSLQAPIDPLCCLVDADQPAADQAIDVTVEAGADPAVVRVVVTDRGGDQVCPAGYIDTGTDGNVTFAAATSAVLPALADASEDDVQLAFFQLNHETTVITAPAGWTPILDDTDSTGATNRLAVYRRRMGTTDTAGSRTFTFSIACSGQGYISNYAGVDPDNPVDVFASAEVASGTAHAAPTVTLTGPGKVVAAVALVASSSFTPPNDMVERHDTAEGAARTLGVFDEWRPAAGATGTMTATSAGAGTSVVASVVLRAAVGTTVSDFTVTVPAGETLTVDGACREVVTFDAPTTYRAMILAAVPLAYLRLGETAGTVADDLMNLAEGTYVNTPALGAAGLLDDPGRSVDLDGANDHVTVAVNLLSSKANGTIETWVRFDGLGTLVGAGHTRIISDGWVELGYTDALLPRLDFYDGVSTFTLTGVAALVAGTTYHLSCTWGAAGKFLYVNGVQVATNASFGGSGNPGVPPYIGKRNATTNFRYVDGRVQEVAIYARQLTAAELLEHHSVGVDADVLDASEANGLGQVDAAEGIIAWPVVPSGERYCVCAYQVGVHDAGVVVTIRSRPSTAV